MEGLIAVGAEEDGRDLLRCFFGLTGRVFKQEAFDNIGELPRPRVRMIRVGMSVDTPTADLIVPDVPWKVGAV